MAGPTWQWLRLDLDAVDLMAALIMTANYWAGEGYEMRAQRETEEETHNA